MTMPPATEPFSFETSYDSGTRIPGPDRSRESKIRRTEDQLFVAFAVFGGLCLLWRYSITLGVFVLGVTTFAWTMRERSREMRKRLERFVDPATRLRVRVTDSGYSVRGDDFFAETSWKRTTYGAVIGGYLVVRASRAPGIYLPIEEMERAGVYGRIKTIVDTHSAERRAALAEAKG